MTHEAISGPICPFAILLVFVGVCFETSQTDNSRLIAIKFKQVGHLSLPLSKPKHRRMNWGAEEQVQFAESSVWHDSVGRLNSITHQTLGLLPAA
jgi:hypothetical protein